MQQEDETFFVHVLVHRAFIRPILDNLNVLHSTKDTGLFILPITLMCKNLHHNVQADQHDLLDSHQHIIVGFYNRQAYEEFLQHEYRCPKVSARQLHEDVHIPSIFRFSSVVRENNDPTDTTHLIDLGALNRAFVVLTNERVGKSAMLHCSLCQKRIKASGAFNHVLTVHVVDRATKRRDPQVMRRCTRLVCYCENIFHANDALALIVHIWRCGLEQKDYETIVAFAEQQQTTTLIYRKDVQPQPLCTRIERNYCVKGCDTQAHIPVQNFQSVFLMDILRQSSDDVNSETLKKQIQTIQEWYGTNRPFH